MDEDEIAAAVADGGAATSTAAAAGGDGIDDDTVVDAEGIDEADDDYQYADYSRFEKSDEWFVIALRIVMDVSPHHYPAASFRSSTLPCG